MQSPHIQRLRVTFGKTGPTRYIGHLDVARTWERALNRAKLPVSYSQGFNRRPKIQFATATALGMTSECELMDVWLTESMEPAQAQAQISQRMAPGMPILAVEEVEMNGPALQTITLSSTYMALIPPDLMPYEQVAERTAALLAAETLPRQRTSKGKAKPYDLRPHILHLHAQPDETEIGHTQLIMELVLEASQTGRPDELLMEIGLDPLHILLHRQTLTLAEQ